VIPNGPPDALHQVVDRYEVGWVVLDENHPRSLGDLFSQTAIPRWLQLVDTIQHDEKPAILIFRVIPDEVQP
jgi:hypothetical protein